MFDQTNGTAAEITIETAIPEHVGLGSGTQANLLGAAAIAHLNGQEFTSHELAEITGRGGTSGIGTAAFESGGFIIDGGHDLSKKGGFLPSSVSDTPPPPVISRRQFPDWQTTLFVPDGEGAHGSDEVDVFQTECPIPATEVAELCRMVIMKLAPAIEQGQFTDFRDALAKLQQMGFKSRELARQPASKRIIDELHKRGCAAGLSSLGPSVFAVHPETIPETKIDCETIETQPDHSGVEITN
jgi:beta-ribofuranosylaminobenzene 5'-phosphate synthase